MKSNETD
jgi:hypothetical protein